MKAAFDHGSFADIERRTVSTVMMTAVNVEKKLDNDIQAILQGRIYIMPNQPHDEASRQDVTWVMTSQLN